MTRLKTLALCCAAATCLAMVLTGCSSQQSYTPPEKTPSLSTPTIGKTGTLRVGVDPDSAPLAGSSSTSKIVGIDVDIAASLADSMGLKLEIVDVGKDPETALKDNKVDIVMGVDASDSDVTFWKSEAYLSSGVALFSTTSNTAVPTKASSPQIAAQASSTSSWQVMNQFGDDALVSENDLKSAFADLSSGKAQYVAADAVRGTYAAHGSDYDAHVVALMQQPSGYCIGVLDTNADLKQAISDAVATLSTNGVVSVIEMKWLGTALDVTKLPLTEGAKAASSDTTTKTDNAIANTTTNTGEGSVAARAGENAVQPNSTETA